MNSFIALLLANFAVCLPSSDGKICDSFLRDGVRPTDFEHLTTKAKSGRTHLAMTGSAFFISENGYLLTNGHVIENASEVVVVQNGTAYYADVKAKNSACDLALLKINLFPRSTNGVIVVNGIPKASPLCFAETCELGQTIYAVGFPETDILGYEAKITRGIINNTSGYKDRKDILQIDAAITHGNSGGPVVDEYGAVVGVACSGIGLTGGNYNYAVRYDTVRKFLGKTLQFSHESNGRKLRVTEIAKRAIRATVLVLVYTEGACERITSTEVSKDDVRAREANTLIKKAILEARLCKIRKEWKDLKEITDDILDKVGEYEDAKELNELARDELGLHLKITAEADGKEVNAYVKPIVGFKDEVVTCDRPVALYGGGESRGFPVEAKLEYEDAEWIWSGELKCRYTWRGTKEMRVVLKHVGKK